MDYTCLIPLDRLSGLSDYKQLLAESVTTQCSGPYWDLLTNPPEGQVSEENVGTDNVDFLSGQSCATNDECPQDYPMCFLRQQCAKPDQDLSNYVTQHYESGNCPNIPCENCQTGTLVPQTIVYQNSFDESFCVECTTTFFKCNEGYVCNLGKCV